MGVQGDRAKPGQFTLNDQKNVPDHFMSCSEIKFGGKVGQRAVASQGLAGHWLVAGQQFFSLASIILEFTFFPC